jgi:hypothetical protein
VSPAARGSLDPTLIEGSKAERRILLTLRLTPREMTLLTTIAEETGLSVSNVVRGRVFGPMVELAARVEALETAVAKLRPTKSRDTSADHAA